jgi:C-terminal processing protease CtpA/Prc
MKRFIPWLAFPAVVLGLASWAHAQTMTKTVTMNGGDVQGQPYSLDELGAVVAQMGTDFKVLFVMDPPARLEPYRSVDLKAEDLLLMVNGKKITSLEMLKATIDSVAMGGQIQLGIRRDKDMQIVHYAKADPKTLPQVKHMTVTQTNVGQGSGEQTFISKGGSGEHVSILKGTGIIVKQGEHGLEVMDLMPMAADIAELKGLAAGDRVVSLQGKKLSDLASAGAAWEALATGEPVKLVCSRNSKEQTYTFAKPDPAKDSGGAVMITK